MKIDLGKCHFDQFHAVLGVINSKMAAEDERTLFAALMAMLATVVVSGQVFDPESAEITLRAMLKEHARIASERN